jgi:hypothetical protein
MSSGWSSSSASASPGTTAPTARSREAIAGRDQFLQIDDTGVHHGYDGVSSNFIAWPAVSRAAIDKSELTLQWARVRISIRLDQLDPEQVGQLKDFLIARRLLKKPG